MGMGRWSTPGVPQRGWVCVGYADLEEGMHTCDMCGTEQIRYVHTMAHPEFAQELEVGCICAEKMEEPYESSAPRPPGDAPKTRERSMRGRAARRAKWVTRKWRPTKKGGFFLKLKEGGLLFVVNPDKGMWRGSFGPADKRSAWMFARQSLESIDEAKLALFDTAWPARTRFWR